MPAQHALATGAVLACRFGTCVWLPLLQVIFLCVLLAVSAQQFTNDAQKFIITPLESMSHPHPTPRRQTHQRRTIAFVPDWRVMCMRAPR
jgi:hypothetical protein